MGLTLFADYIDAIAVITIDETPTLGTLTVNSVAGTESGDTKITVNPAKENANNVYKYKVAAGAHGTEKPTLRQQPDRKSQWLSVMEHTKH